MIAGVLHTLRQDQINVSVSILILTCVTTLVISDWHQSLIIFKELQIGQFSGNTDDNLKEITLYLKLPLRPTGFR